jgi:hypothetical protein
MVHFWSDGALFRSEAVIAGRKIVTVVSAEKYYVVDAVGGTGIAIERSDAAKALDGNRARPFANEFEELLRNGGEHIRTEKVATRTLEVYRVTDARGRRTIWVMQTDPPVPLRVETYDRESATTGRVDYMNWLQGPLIDESFFMVDPRWRIEQISYKDYRKRIRKGPVGPAPVLYQHLLHGESRD